MSRKGKVQRGSDLSALQGDHVWLNPTPADKTRVAIGGIIKETKPGKILVEDDEGKVSMATHSSEAQPSQLPSRTLSPLPSLVLLPTPGIIEPKSGNHVAG